MDISSDSDDSAFLFSTNILKRKAGYNVENKLKKLRLSSLEKNKLVDGIEMEEKKKGGSSEGASIHTDSLQDANEMNLLASESHVLSSNEEHAGEKDVEAEKLEPQNEEYFSCPLCLKILHSEITHFTHMKQCAKKYKMNAKELLEALQLHKQHLKERMQAGLSNIPKKKKKIQIQENGDSADQLAVALALSKSLEDYNDSWKVKENVTDSISIHRSNKTTLEKFGFTSSGKNYCGTGKRSKNWKLTHSVLRERSDEEREKLMTEKASVVLLISDEAPISEAKESLRMYHCKKLEGIRNKDSHLWKLGETIEGSEWYVEDLKDIILEKNFKREEKSEDQNVIVKQCRFDEEMLKLNLPKTSIFEDWKRLVNNKNLSDLTFITKDGGTIYLHSVVLYARCQKLLDYDLKCIFYKFDSFTVLQFLHYLYCGTLDGVTQSDVENLFNLAKSVDYQELVEILNSLMQSLSESNCADSNHSEINSAENGGDVNNWYEPECIDSRSSEETTIWNDTLDGKDQTLLNHVQDIDCDEKFIGNLSQDHNESGVDDEITNSFGRHSRESKTAGNDNPLHDVNIQKDEETGNWNARERVDQSERDMFEEVENFENESNPIVENGPECIEISSGSTKSLETEQRENRDFEENEKLLTEADYDIPYFDPYEHFNSDILETEPFPSQEEQSNHSQSLIAGEISPVKSITPILDNPASPGVPAPECCSTPNIDVSQPSTSAISKYITRKCSDKKKRRYATPCSKISRKSGRASIKSKLFGSKSVKKKKTETGLDENDTEKVASFLTESILKELDSSIGAAARATPQTDEKKYVEVTPTVPGEEYSEDVSPFPDYSVMGASSIKKHLTKYGLKKSLSKSKAKKILRHIYEELHPIVNTKNGKIVKFIESEKSKKRKGKKVGTKAKQKEKRSTSGKLSSTSTAKGENRTEVHWSEPETPTKKKTSNTLDGARVTSPNSRKPTAEDDTQSCTSVDSFDGTPEGSTLSDGKCFEVEEPLSQGNYSSATDAPTALYDFIHNNKDIHRRILMYEPIWLEDLQRKLFDTYDKKFKLTDLMDCLDSECITFRCESQRRTNSRRK